MSAFTWSDIPTDLQDRVSAGDRLVLNPLAAWLHAHHPGWVSEDVLQKLLSTLYGMMNTDPGRQLLMRTRSIPGLLASIASRHRSSERRADARLRRRIAGFVAAGGAVPGAADPLTVVARAEVRAAILASLARLRPIEREALVRAAVLGHSYKAIATSIFGEDRGGKNEQRLRTLVHRARRKLRSRLKGLGDA
jgi:DNA-directed RNA polymerase specialized sigma24 family protein